MPAGIGVAILGIFVLAQVLAGQALERLHIVRNITG